MLLLYYSPFTPCLGTLYADFFGKSVLFNRHSQQNYEILLLTFSPLYGIISIRDIMYLIFALSLLLLLL